MTNSVDTSTLHAYEDPAGRIYIAYSAAQLADAHALVGGHFTADDFHELERDLVIVNSAGRRLDIGETLDRAALEISTGVHDPSFAADMEALATPWLIDP